MKLSPIKQKLILMLCGLIFLQIVSLYYISTREYSTDRQVANLSEEPSRSGQPEVKDKELGDKPGPAEENTATQIEEEEGQIIDIEAELTELSNLDLAALLEAGFHVSDRTLALDYNLNLEGISIQETFWHMPVTHPDYMIHLLISETAHARRYDIVLINPENSSLKAIQLLTEAIHTHPSIGHINWLSREELVYIVDQTMLQGENVEATYTIHTLNINTLEIETPFTPIELTHHKYDGYHASGWTELDQEKRFFLNLYSEGSTFIIDLEASQIIELEQKIINQWPIFLYTISPNLSGLVSYAAEETWSLYNKTGELILLQEKLPQVLYRYPTASWHHSGTKFLTAYASEIYELEEGHNYSIFALQGVELFTADGASLIHYKTPHNRFFDILYWYDQELLIHEYAVHKAEGSWYYQPVQSSYYLLDERTGKKTELQVIADVAQLNPSFKPVKTNDKHYSLGYLLSTQDRKLFLFDGDYENYLAFIEIGEHAYYVRRADTSYFYLNLSKGSKVDIDFDSKGQQHWDVEYYFMPKWRLDHNQTYAKKIVYIKNLLYD